MRLRTLLTTAVVSALIAGGTGMTAQATPAGSPARAGTVVAWGDTTDAQVEAAIDVPADLAAPAPTAPVVSVATTGRSTAAVTADGRLRVWGDDTASEVTDVPQGVTDAVAVALTLAGGLVLHRDGTVTGWGTPAALAEGVPEGLRAQAIAIGLGGTAYAVTTDGELKTWGQTPVYTVPDGLTGLVDVAAGNAHLAVLKADGTVAAWTVGYPAYEPLADVPDFGTRKAIAIDAGSMATGVILDDGSIEVWGRTAFAGQPRFGSSKVVSLDVADNNVGAITEDGGVHTWGSNGVINAHPDVLTGESAGAIALGATHAVVVLTTFREVAAPTVVGTPQVGRTLRARAATFSLAPDAPPVGQWYADAAPIAGETGARLTLDETMLGKRIAYHSTATRRGHRVNAVSNEVGPVAAAPGDDDSAAKAKSKIKRVKVKAKGNKKVAKKVRIAIAVKSAQGVSPKGKVAVALKGKTKKNAVATVNAKGKAKVTIKKVKRGKYKVRLKYRGNAEVASAKKTVKVRV